MAAQEITQVDEKMATLEIGHEDPLCWWWAYSRRDIWLAECRNEYVTPEMAWSAACMPYTAHAADWLTRMCVPWKMHHGYICVRDPVGPWLRLRLLHYGAPPTSYEPIICRTEFAKIGTVGTIKRDRVEFGRDVMHRSAVKIANVHVVWDLPARISLESVFYGSSHIYIFTLDSFVKIRARLTVSDCLHIEQEIV